MKIFKATRNYESWLRSGLDVFEDDLALKTDLLAKDAFTFLRRIVVKLSLKTSRL